MDNERNKNRVMKRKTLKRELKEWINALGIAFVITLFINSYVFSMPEIRQNSMENTLFEGERVFLFKLNYYLEEPKKGDIIILNKYEDNRGILNNIPTTLYETAKVIMGKNEKKYLIKRVIGIPGDIIDIKNGYVFLNGQILEEFYVKGKTYADGKCIEFPIKVPKNKVFVMGDNRQVSLDSRELGLIDYSQIQGKVLYKIWPLKKIGTVYKNQ